QVGDPGGDCACLGGFAADQGGGIVTRAPSATRAAAHANPTHIYVIGYSDGVVKVGRTSNPRSRMTTLRSEASRAGRGISSSLFWAVPNAAQSEWHLRLVGRGFFKPVSAEYFEADFDEFVATVMRKFEDYGLNLPAPAEP